jgi:hypothetical protein
MAEYINEDILLRELYPDLSETERTEVKEFLDAYCAIILEMYDQEAQQETLFDESASSL